MSQSKSKLKVLFIGKAENFYAKAAADFIQLHFEDPLIVFSQRSAPFPEELMEWKGDLLISYLAQWIIPNRLLANADLAAINLHPGPPDYPGIGCTNFAVYNEEKEFGITCHHMLSKVDSGSIIAVRRFAILGTDTVYSITQRCYTEILHLFLEVMTGLLQGKHFPESRETWTRKPYKRKDLDELCELRPGMTEEEVQRRIKATTYGDEVWAFQTAEKMPARNAGIK
jgi:methionyl-tRNA formyltransferase